MASDFSPFGGCAHCGLERLRKGRGLCYKCHGQLDIRGQYPSERIGRNKPLTEVRCKGPDPRGGTDATPGTLVKIEVMEWRAENGWAVFHREDYRGPLRPGERPNTAVSEERNDSKGS